MNRKGFSLIELIIVLILISLSISLVAPSLARFSKSIELKATAKKISGILRYCRSEAIQTGKTQRVLFDAHAKEVRVQAMDPSSESGETEPPQEAAREKKYLLPGGIQIQEWNVADSPFPSELPGIEFYPNGGSNGGSILLSSENQKGYRIKIHFLTGVVEVESS